MNQIVMEEMSRYHSLAMLSVHVTTPPTVHLIITYGPNMNHSNHSNGSTNETTGMYRPGMNHSNGSTTETTSMTMMTTGMYRPGMNHSNGSTTETTSMTWMTSTMMMADVARLEGCMGLSVSDASIFAGSSDAFQVLEEALARAAGSGVMVEHVSVSIVPGETCATGPMSSTTWFGGRRLQGAGEDVKVEYVIHFPGHAGAEVAIQAAERSKRALEEISLNQMNQIVMEEMSRYHSLAMLSVHVTTPPTVHLIITYGPSMNHSNGSTNETTGMYRPGMNHSNGSTTETTSMTMMTTGMYRPGMNHSNGSTTETTSMTWMTSTMMMADVARLEGCMGLSVSDARMFAGSADAFRVLEEALARAAGGEVMVEHVSVSIMPGETCATGPMSSTTWSGGRRLQGAEEDVKVEYVIHFTGHAGADAAIQAAERSKRALEEISLNQMNQIVMEEMSRYHSLAMLSVHVTTPPTVHLIITYGPNMNHSNGSTTETTSMTMMTTGMYRPGMNHSNGSTTETTSMTWMTSTMMMADVARLEGCMGLSVSDAGIFAGSSDAFRVLEETLARAAGGEVMAEHVSVSIMPGETCPTGPMLSTTWSGGRRLQGAEEDVKVEYVIHFSGHAGADAAIQAAERSKRALEEISLNQMNQIVIEEMSRYHSLAMLSVHVTTPPTVHLIITYGPNMNHSNHSNGSTNETTGMYRPGMNHSNGSTTETTSMTMMTTGMYRPGMNHSNGSTTETTSMTWMTSTMMMADVARLEGCMGLSVSDASIFAGSSDAFQVLEEALARAAGSGVMVEHVSVSIVPGETCATGPMSSTTWFGGRRLQGAEEDAKVEYVIHFPGHAGAEVAIQAAERSKRALEEISLNQMNQIVMEEMSRYHSLAMLSVHVTTPPTVHLIITYGPNMNHSNHSNGSTTETTSMTWMTSTMMMADVARLEGCMGLSVSDARMFAGSSDAFRLLEEALARAAGGEVMVEHVSVSIMPGETCATGPMSSTTWSGGRRLQGAEEDVKVEYVIHFPGHAGAEAAIQAAERSKRALEEISLNQMNQIVMEEMSRYHSLAMLLVHVTTPPTVHLIITYGPNMNHSNGSTTETTSMTWMTSTMMMADVARLEGCMGLSVSDAGMFAGSSDAFRVLEEALARAAGGEVMVEHVSVSIMPGETCATGPMSSTTWLGGRRLQGAEEDVKVKYVIRFPSHAGAEAAIQAAERSKRALEEISLNQMNQIVMEEMSRYHSLAMLSVHVTTPPTVHLIITYGPNMNHSNGSTTETTSMTWMTSTMMMADVARLEGCMGLSVSDAGMFAGSSDAFRVLEEALARAAGGEVMVEHVSVSIMPGETCATGPMSSTNWSGGRRLQGAGEDVKVEYVIHFPGHAGAEVAIQAAERSKRALEEISLNQMNQIVMEEMSRYHSLAMLSVHVTTPPTVHLIITYGPNMNHSNGSTTETTSMTWMTSTMMMADVARLEGCMGLSVSDAGMFAGSSDAFRVLEEALARAAGGEVMVEHVSVSIMPGETCGTGPMSSTTWSGGRRLQGAEEDVKVEYVIHFPGHAGAEVAIQAAERSKRALEEISLNQMNQIVMEEMSRYHSLAMLSVHVTTPPTVHLIITYGPNMNHSNGSTTETTSMTWMTSTMMMADVARLEGCMGLSVSDARMFAGSSDAFRVLEEALARAAGSGVMVEHVSVSIMPGETCATGPMSSTTWSGGRRLQGAEEDVKVEYLIHFPGHAGAEAAIQAAERSKRALEEISLNQMNQIVMEEMSRYHSLAMLSVHVTTPPTVHLIITYGPNMNHSNGSTTETTSMTWMTSTMMMADVARLEGCMGLSVSDAGMFAGSSDAFRVLEEALARAAGGEVMVEHVSVSIMPGETCATGPMSSTTWSGGRRLQGAEEDVKVEYLIHFPGHAGAEAAIQAAERSKRALEEISLNQMNQIVMEEMSRYHSLAMLLVHVTTPPTVHLIITYGPNMNHSNGSTTETTSMTWMTSTMMMADVARLEGCMGLSVSDAGMFAGSSDAFRVLEEALARAAGGEVMVEHVFVSIMPGETCVAVPMSSTTYPVTSVGGRLLQGVNDTVRVDYVILFSQHASAEAAVQAAERSKVAIEQLSLNQMTQIIMEEMSRYPSLTVTLSVTSSFAVVVSEWATSTLTNTTTTTATTSTTYTTVTSTSMTNTTTSTSGTDTTTLSTTVVTFTNTSTSTTETSTSSITTTYTSVTNTTTSTSVTTSTSMTTTVSSTLTSTSTYTSATNTTTSTSVTTSTSMTTTVSSTLTSTSTYTSATNTTTSTSVTTSTSMTTTVSSTLTSTSTFTSVTNTTTSTSVTTTTSMTTTSSSTDTSTSVTTSFTNTTTSTSLTRTTSLTTTSTSFTVSTTRTSTGTTTSFTNTTTSTSLTSTTSMTTTTTSITTSTTQTSTVTSTSFTNTTTSTSLTSTTSMTTTTTSITTSTTQTSTVTSTSFTNTTTSTSLTSTTSMTTTSTSITTSTTKTVTMTSTSVTDTTTSITTTSTTISTSSTTLTTSVTNTTTSTSVTSTTTMTTTATSTSISRTSTSLTSTISTSSSVTLTSTSTNTSSTTMSSTTSLSLTSSTSTSTSSTSASSTTSSSSSSSFSSSSTISSSTTTSSTSEPQCLHSLNLFDLFALLMMLMFLIVSCVWLAHLGTRDWGVADRVDRAQHSAASSSERNGQGLPLPD